MKAINKFHFTAKTWLYVALAMLVLTVATFGSIKLWTEKIGGVVASGVVVNFTNGDFILVAKNNRQIKVQLSSDTELNSKSQTKFLSNGDKVFVIGRKQNYNMIAAKVVNVLEKSRQQNYEAED